MLSNRDALGCTDLKTRFANPVATELFGEPLEPKGGRARKGANRDRALARHRVCLIELPRAKVRCAMNETKKIAPNATEREWR